MTLDELKEYGERSGPYVAGACHALARLAERSPVLAEAALAEAEALKEALTPDPEPVGHWSHRRTRR